MRHRKYFCGDDSVAHPTNLRVRHKNAKRCATERRFCGSGGGGQRQVLEAIVTSKDETAWLIIFCMLYDKLKHWKWRIVQSHQDGENAYVYAKIRHADLVRFHAKMYSWGEARAKFCSVHTVLPVTPERMDAHLVVQLS